MGIFDTTSRVLLEFKADTNDARRAIRKLKGEQRKQAEAALQATEKQNRGLERQIATIGKVAIGVGSAIAAFKGLSAAADFYAKRQQQIAASAGIDIGRIQKAARGLIGETEALTLAAASQNTAWDISQEQLETVAKAMISLRNQGNDMAVVQQRVTQAIVEGNVEALRPMGIVLRGTTGEAETFKMVMEALGEEARKTSASIEVAGDAAARAKVSFGDLWDRIKAGAGQAADEVTRFAVKASTELAKFNREFNNTIFFGGEDVAEENARAARDRFDAAIGARLKAERRQGAREIVQFLADNPDIVRTVGGAVFAVTGSATAALDASAARLMRNFERLGRRAGGGDANPFIFGGDAPRTAAPRVDNTPQAVGSFGLPGVGLAGTGQQLAANGLVLPTEGIAGALSMGEQLGESLKDAKIAEQLDRVNQAAITFGNVGAKAFGAWLSGAKSLKEALRDAVSETLVGLSAEMAGKAIFHGAAAIGSLALGIGGDAKALAAAKFHGTAAAEYAAGAVAVGALAKAFGGSSKNAGAGSGGGALPAAAAGAQGGGGGGTSQQTFIVVQDQFDDNPREARRRMRRAIDRANEGGSRSGAVIRA